MLKRHLFICYLYFILVNPDRPVLNAFQNVDAEKRGSAIIVGGEKCTTLFARWIEVFHVMMEWVCPGQSEREEIPQRLWTTN
jgi:hypothetical protein